jgi:hypothetical protein
MSPPLDSESDGQAQEIKVSSERLPSDAQAVLQPACSHDVSNLTLATKFVSWAIA